MPKQILYGSKLTCCSNGHMQGKTVHSWLDLGLFEDPTSIWEAEDLSGLGQEMAYPITFVD